MLRITSRSAVLTLVAALGFFAAPLAAQGTAPVPPSDLAYRDLDRLEQLGLIDSMIVGQRPYSYREFGRLVHQARANADRARSPEERTIVDGLLDRLGRRFDDPAPRPVAALFDEAAATVGRTSASRRQPLGNLGAQVETGIDPLASRRLGTPAVRGGTGALELAQRVEPLPMLSFNARERFELRSPTDGSIAHQHSELLLGGARLRYRNLAFMAGREQLTWASSEGDGLFLASDAPALDQLSLAGDQPFMLPGILRRLGPAQATLVLADLGASVSHSHSRLLAYKVSVQPTRTIELGGSFFNHYGGAGSRGSSIGNRIIDFLPFIDIFRRHNYEDTTKTLEVESDKLLGIDGRVRFDQLGGLTVRGEWLIDDFDAHRLLSLLNIDGSHSIAILLPRLGTPALSLELTAKHTGIFTYDHGQLASGITTRRRLLGDELGPNAKAFGAQLGWTPAPAIRFTLGGRTALYSDADYGSVYSDSAHVNYVISAVARRPNELRDQLIATLLVQPTERRAFQLRAGAQRTRNSPVPGLNGRSYVVEAMAVVRP